MSEEFHDAVTEDPEEDEREEEEIDPEDVLQARADAALIPELRGKLSNLEGDDRVDPAELKALLDNEYTLSRFLIARENKVEKAFRMARDYVVWRSQFRPSQITVADFATANSQGVYRFAGFAKNGWPILWVHSKNWNPWAYSIEEYTKMVAFFLESLEKHCKPDFKVYIVIDMLGMSYLANDILKVRQLAKLTADYFPERLGYGVVLHADVLFYSIWTIISPLLDRRTRAKARIFRSGFLGFLEEHIGLDHVPEDVGGTRQAPWPLLTEANQNTLFQKDPITYQTQQTEITTMESEDMVESS